MTASDVASRSRPDRGGRVLERQRAAVDEQAAEAAAPQRVERLDERIGRAGSPAALVRRRPDSASPLAAVVAVVRSRSSPSASPFGRQSQLDDRIVEADEQARAFGSASSASATTSGDSRSTWRAALPADRLADARPEQPQVVVNLGRRADRRARIADAVLLPDGDRRRDAVDAVDVRLLHPLEELAGVGRQRLDVAALPFGVDGVEGERRLARPADAREHDELAVRQRQVDALQVVGAGAADDERAGRASPRPAIGFGHEATSAALRRVDPNSHVLLRDRRCCPRGRSRAILPTVHTLPILRSDASSPTCA